MHKDSAVYVAGHTGLAGSAILRALRHAGYTNLLTPTHGELDLLDQKAAAAYLLATKPGCVIAAAAKVGGIMANSTCPADFLYQNLTIETNLIHAAYTAGVKRLVFLGSSCIYPKLCPQPIKEEYLLTGPLEPTNEGYAIAKIAGVKMCEYYNRQYGMNYLPLMPTNLYGQGDNFDAKNSHVLPALLRRFHEAAKSGAPEVTLWGTGKPKREFLHADDLGGAVCHLLGKDAYNDLTNVGTGKEVTIAELAAIIAEVTGYKGAIKFDASKPDGTPRKLLDVSRLESTGWRAKIDLKRGIEMTYTWYLANEKNLRGVK